MKTVHMVVLLLTLALTVSCNRTKQPTITQEEMMRRTQELMDAVAGGDQTPFKKYFADDALFFDEKGRNMDKAALVNDISPLPKGYSGTIKLVKAQSRIFPETAILSYDLDETETIFGQDMTARYHGTDTWMLRNGQWQIVASQALRYYEDPAPGKPDLKKYAEYVGTYEIVPGNAIVVSREGNDLYAKRGDRAKELLIPEASDIFFRKGVEGRRLFRRRDDGKVDALIDRRNNEDTVWKKIK